MSVLDRPDRPSAINQFLQASDWYDSSHLEHLPKCILAHAIPTTAIALAFFSSLRPLPLLAIELSEILSSYCYRSVISICDRFNTSEETKIAIYRTSKFALTLLLGGTVSKIFSLSFGAFATYFVWTELIHALIDGLVFGSIYIEKHLYQLFN